jgi:hypothetical protein
MLGHVCDTTFVHTKRLVRGMTDDQIVLLSMEKFPTGTATS